MSPNEYLQDYANQAAQRLLAAGCAPQALGRLVPAQRRLFGTRPVRIEQIGQVWRLGVLLLQTAHTSQARWLAAGASLRAHQPPPVLGYTSNSARVRDELRHAAIRGGFVEGAVVHYNAADLGEITATSAPVSIRDGQLVVRWNGSCTLAQAQPFDVYVEEQLMLLEARGV